MILNSVYLFLSFGTLDNLWLVREYSKLDQAVLLVKLNLVLSKDPDIESLFCVDVMQS